ncbi:MAG: nitroreductase family protein [Bacteroidales bacterium]|nr:nitroreductase family protein [Bacteroidales bacterium]MBR6416014.1 nitroreductase family protein [Bacteroidales bacterium]
MRAGMISAAFVAALAMALSSCGSAPELSKEQIVLDNIFSRKSVRSFTEEPVTSQQIETLLKAGMAAPSGSNIQPWSFVVLQDKDRYMEIFGENNFNQRIFAQSAAIIVVCSDTTVVRAPRNDPQGTPVKMANGTWRDDAGAVTENILLAVEAMDLGAVWTACYPYPDRMNPVKASLGLPSEVVPYSVIALGHPSGDDQPKDKWKPEKVHYGKW